MSLASRLATSSIALLSFVTACAAPDPGEPLGEARDPIVGGVLDGFRSYVVGVGDELGTFCTGTLISRRTVLTAGHCYTPGKANGGLTRVYFGPDISRRQTFVTTAQAVRRPGFSDATLTLDLTLVELSADPPAPWQAVPLLRESMSNTPDFVGPSFTFVGYGNDGATHYDVRRVVTFPIDRVGPDGDVGVDTQSGPIDATQFYYRAPHRNTCDGDSGGPAFVVRDRVERLAGATSYGDQDCQIDGVDARTDAPAIAAFIQPTLDGFEGADPCRADGVCDESCNVGGALVDPDCAPNHCGADGICVLSCADPPDPDCAAVDHCGPDGVCDPSCDGDPDCPARRDDGAGGHGPVADAGAASSSSSGGGAGGSARSGAQHDGQPSGGGCSVTRTGGEEPLVLGLTLGALALRRRRRR